MAAETFQRVLEEYLLQLEGLEVDLSLAILIYHYPGDSYLHCMCKKVHYAITIKDLFSLFSSYFPPLFIPIDHIND